MNFDDYGNIVYPVSYGNKTKLYCPRTGETHDLKDNQTILETIMTEQSEIYKYDKLIDNSIHDPAALLYTDVPCPKCGVTLYIKIRVGDNEKLFKKCKNGHLV